MHLFVTAVVLRVIPAAATTVYRDLARALLCRATADPVQVAIFQAVTIAWQVRTRQGMPCHGRALARVATPQVRTSACRASNFLTYLLPSRLSIRFHFLLLPPPSGN